MSTGAAGSTATVTITGTAPNYVLNFTIPKGDKGDAGEAGTGGNVDLSGYAKLEGATFTGHVTSPIVSATRYFETPTLVGEGDDSTYYHRVVFGHKNFDKMEFYEYGGLFNFLENKRGGVNEGRLLFQISTSGVNSIVPLKEDGVRVYSPHNKPTAADLGITNGVTPTLSIGTVTTGTAGSSANVTMSGTAPDYVLNFTIPKGDKGDRGDTDASLAKVQYASSVNITNIRNYIDVTGDITITLPSYSDRYSEANPFTYEYHVYMKFTDAHIVTFADTIKWQSVPTIKGGTVIDFIFNFIHTDANTNLWLGGAVVYE